MIFIWPTYDLVSRLVSLTDPPGLSTQFRYDDLNRVTEIADARQGLTRFEYDPNGNLLSVTDAKGQTTTYTYDSMDRLDTRTDALNRTEFYQYDPAGNLTQFTDRKSQVSAFTYDPLNRRTAAQYADSTTSFAYDSAGRLSVAEDSLSGKIEFTYDALDRLVKELTPQGVVEYTYDALGRRSEMIANGQQPVAYSYDAASRLTQVAQGSLQVGLGYDAAGRRASLTYPNGTNTTYTYDNASRLTDIVHQGPSALIESLAYSYDAAGNRTSLTRANATATLLPDPVQAAYDAANEQIQFGNPLPATPNLTYDANGNLTSQNDANGTTTYTWDARNRLVAITGPSVSASFQYDSLGRRVIKTINGATTEFLYDRHDIVAEIASGAVGASYMRSLNIDEPFVRQGAPTEVYHADALASTLALTNSTGETAAAYTYEPFGKTAVAGTSNNPFQYAGRENDENDLYYYRARYYNQISQRFLSEDLLFSPVKNNIILNVNPPVCLTQGGSISIIIPLNHRNINLYTYAINDPLTYNDPFGLDPLPLCKTIEFTCKLYLRVACAILCGLDPPTLPVCLPSCFLASKLGCRALVKSLKNFGQCTGDFDETF